VGACARPKLRVQAVSACSSKPSRIQLISHCFSAKKTGGVLGAPSNEPLDADAATWSAVEASHGSLAACALAHVQALAVASAAAAAQYQKK
jgi:hypothetical protein